MRSRSRPTIHARKFRPSLAALLALATMAVTFPAIAGVFSVAGGPASGPPGGIGAPALLLQFAGDGATGAAQVDYRVDATLFELTATPLGALTCVVVAPGRVRMMVLNFDGTPLPASDTTYCAITVAIAPYAPLGSYAVESVPGSAMCAQGSEPVSPCIALDAPAALVVELDDEMSRDDFE